MTSENKENTKGTNRTKDTRNKGIRRRAEGGVREEKDGGGMEETKGKGTVKEKRMIARESY